MILSPNFPRYRAAELIQFTRNVVEIVDANDAPTLNLQTQRDALASRLEALAAEFRPVLASEVTAELVALDERRDRAISGISNLVRAYLNHYDSSRVAAANRLLEDLERHGPMVGRLRYQLETGVLATITTDWLSKDPLLDAVQDLDLEDWVLELKAANDEFDDKYVQRARETAGDPSQIAALRDETVEAWRTLVAHLTAHATLTPSAAYDALGDELNSLITNYNEAVQARENGGEEEGEPGEEPAPE
ncbi:DUF6261 family protein [Roseibacillus ishigakijimensis]|uniref:Uncharacterized protein n=1 Tax=Roseibacillus ishigakijimensis TaxID=454146 RepID=A0A934RRH3_9BACT|nr:DUF6261 family protein [Roseibacillus ishigakijimensis]MBK1835615.1 hypothetical protein [Roseibacillus ishigakijimensis]